MCSIWLEPRLSSGELGLMSRGENHEGKKKNSIKTMIKVWYDWDLESETTVFKSCFPALAVWAYLNYLLSETQLSHKNEHNNTHLTHL